jgi:hypothetical protein
VNGYIPDKNIIFEKFKIARGEQNLGILLRQSDFVVKDMRNQIELAAKLVQDRNNLINAIHITPQDLENLLIHSDIDSPFKWEIIPI